MPTCGKTTRIATSASAVVVPSRSPIIVDVRCGRSSSVAAIVATTRRGGRKGKSSRQVDGVAGSRALPSVRKQAHVASNVLRDLYWSPQGSDSGRRRQPGVSQMWITLGVGVGTRTVGADTSSGATSADEASESALSGGITTGESSGSKSLSATNVGGSSSSSSPSSMKPSGSASG